MSTDTAQEKWGMERLFFPRCNESYYEKRIDVNYGNNKRKKKNKMEEMMQNLLAILTCAKQ